MALADPIFDPELKTFFESYGMERCESGVFVAPLNLHLAMANRSNKHWRNNYYGVCDSLDQLKTTQIWNEIVSDPRHMALVLTPMKKSEQEPDGGWRWHKWGEYVGVQKPQYEYLYDEPEIELVYVFDTVVLEPTEHRRKCS